MAKSPIVLPLSTTFLQRFSQHFSTDSGRNPIGRRTESDWTANGNRSDGGRNLIRRRTETDRTANANGGTLRGALVSARLCRMLEQEVHQPSKECTNRARVASTEQGLHPLRVCQNYNIWKIEKQTIQIVGGYGISFPLRAADFQFLP